jgi:hypothetical protein
MTTSTVKEEEPIATFKISRMVGMDPDQYTPF